ncbi:Fc.00g071650.m01.CDS01 [Cosmosporella sp. VM-42]
MHSRSFSNDRAVAMALEPRRHRRMRSRPDWPSTDPIDHIEEHNTKSQATVPPQLKSHDVLPTTGPSPGVGPVTWMALPRKGQLAILFVSRFVDFLQVASLQAYVFYQLKHMDDSLSDAHVSRQAGLLQGCFTGAQVCTAILWGKAADASWCGRKWVLVIGLGGTAISCLGYGFATTFFWAAFWRVFGGAINGTVGIIRTMIAEITREKRFQSRAFLILPMSFNVASMLGPVMGGMLAHPTMTLPGLFGEDEIFGFQWIRNYPFALPSLMNALFLTIATALVFLFLEETSKERIGKYDPGLELAARIKRHFKGSQTTDGYSQVPIWEEGEVAMETFQEKTPAPIRPSTSRTLPFSRLWTRNVIFTLITGAFYDFQLGAFTNIWSLFLSTPRYGSHIATQFDQKTVSPEDNTVTPRSLPLLFTGGLGMPASTVGVATSFLGIIGMTLQLFLYPPVQARLGTIRSFRWFLLLFPVAYFVAPYLSILPSSSPAPEPSSGTFIWVGIILVLLLQVTARTFTLPASIILLNNCSPHPSVLGTIHGLGQSVSAGFRTVGPVVGGWWYAYGLDIGMVAWGWWGVAALSVLGCSTAFFMHEGSGHEIYLEGERDEMDED